MVTVSNVCVWCMFQMLTILYQDARRSSPFPHPLILFPVHWFPCITHIVALVQAGMFRGTGVFVCLHLTYLIGHPLIRLWSNEWILVKLRDRSSVAFSYRDK